MTAYRALVYSVLSTLRFDRFDWGRHFDLAPDAFEILAVLLGKDWPPSMVAGLPLTMLCRTRSCALPRAPLRRHVGLVSHAFPQTASERRYRFRQRGRYLRMARKARA